MTEEREGNPYRGFPLLPFVVMFLLPFLLGIAVFIFYFIYHYVVPICRWTPPNPP